jgi:PhnB protein
LSKKWRFDMLGLTPFLLFDGYCDEAMAFYQSCLGGELSITRLGDTPMGRQASPEQRRKVAYAHLKSGALEFSATDWQHQTRRPVPGNTVAIYVTGGTYAQLRDIFDKLSVDADKELLDDLQDLPFGTYGHLADRYGVHWFFTGESRSDASRTSASES